MTIPMLTLILLGLGGLVGLVVATATSQQTHQLRFNMVSAGLLGALVGGLGLPQIVRDVPMFGEAPIMTALLFATLVAVAFTTALALIRHRLIR